MPDIVQFTGMPPGLTPANQLRWQQLQQYSRRRAPHQEEDIHDQMRRLAIEAGYVPLDYEPSGPPGFIDNNLGRLSSLGGAITDFNADLVTPHLYPPQTITSPSDYTQQGPQLQQMFQQALQAQPPPPASPEGFIERDYQATLPSVVGESGPYIPPPPDSNYPSANYIRLRQIGASSPEKAAEVQSVLQNTQPATMLNALPREDIPGPAMRTFLQGAAPFVDAYAQIPRVALRGAGALGGNVGATDFRDATNRMADAMEIGQGIGEMLNQLPSESYPEAAGRFVTGIGGELAPIFSGKLMGPSIKGAGTAVRALETAAIPGPMATARVAEEAARNLLPTSNKLLGYGRDLAAGVTGFSLPGVVEQGLKPGGPSAAQTGLSLIGTPYHMAKSIIGDWGDIEHPGILNVIKNYDQYAKNWSPQSIDMLRENLGPTAMLALPFGFGRLSADARGKLDAGLKTGDARAIAIGLKDIRTSPESVKEMNDAQAILNSFQANPEAKNLTERIRSAITPTDLTPKLEAEAKQATGLDTAVANQSVGEQAGVAPEALKPAHRPGDASDLTPTYLPLSSRGQPETMRPNFMRTPPEARPPDAVQIESPGSVLQYPPEGTGEGGGGRGRVQPGVEGNEPASPRKLSGRGRRQPPPRRNEPQVTDQGQVQVGPPQVAVAPFGKLFDESIGQYQLGPVETETGTKFGVFDKSDLRGGPVARFESRGTAIDWMKSQNDAQSQAIPGQEVAEVRPGAAEPRVQQPAATNDVRLEANDARAAVEQQAADQRGAPGDNRPPQLRDQQPAVGLSEERSPPPATEVGEGLGQQQSAPLVPHKDAFARLVKELPRDDLVGLLSENGLDLTPDNKVRFVDERGGGTKIPMGKKDFIGWVLGHNAADNPLDPKKYQVDPEWKSLVERARTIASKPSEISPESPVSPRVESGQTSETAKLVESLNNYNDFFKHGGGEDAVAKLGEYARQEYGTVGELLQSYNFRNGKLIGRQPPSEIKDLLPALAAKFKGREGELVTAEAKQSQQGFGSLEANEGSPAANKIFTDEKAAEAKKRLASNLTGRANLGLGGITQIVTDTGYLAGHFAEQMVRRGLSHSLYFVDKTLKDFHDVLKGFLGDETYNAIKDLKDRRGRNILKESMIRAFTKELETKNLKREDLVALASQRRGFRFGREAGMSTAAAKTLARKTVRQDALPSGMHEYFSGKSGSTIEGWATADVPTRIGMASDSNALFGDSTLPADVRDNLKAAWASSGGSTSRMFEKLKTAREATAVKDVLKDFADNMKQFEVQQGAARKAEVAANAKRIGEEVTAAAPKRGFISRVINRDGPSKNQVELGKEMGLWDAIKRGRTGLRGVIANLTRSTNSWLNKDMFVPLQAGDSKGMQYLKDFNTGIRDITSRLKLGKSGQAKYRTAPVDLGLDIRSADGEPVKLSGDDYKEIYLAGRQPRQAKILESDTRDLIFIRSTNAGDKSKNFVIAPDEYAKIKQYVENDSYLKQTSDLFSQLAEKLHPDASKANEAMVGKPLGYVEGYHMLNRDMDQSNRETSRISQKANRGSGWQAQEDLSYAQSRQASNLPIKLSGNSLARDYAYLKSMSDFAYKGPLVRDALEALHHGDALSAITKAHGRETFNQLVEDIRIAGGQIGPKAMQTLMDVNRGLSKLVGKGSRSVLWGRPGPFLRNITQGLPQLWQGLEPSDVIKYNRAVAELPIFFADYKNQTNKLMNAGNGGLAFRVSSEGGHGAISPDVNPYLTAPKTKLGDVAHSVGELGMSPVQISDNAVTWVAYRIGEMKFGKGTQQAADFADHLIRNTQNAISDIDTPDILRVGRHSLASPLFMLAGSGAKAADAAITNWRFGNRAQSLAAAAVTAVGGTAVTGGVGLLMGRKKDKETTGEYIVRSAVNAAAREGATYISPDNFTQNLIQSAASSALAKRPNVPGGNVEDVARLFSAASKFASDDSDKNKAALMKAALPVTKLMLMSVGAPVYPLEVAEAVAGPAPVSHGGSSNRSRGSARR